VIIILLFFYLGADVLFYKPRWGILPAYKSLFYIHLVGIIIYAGIGFLYLVNENKQTGFNRILHYIIISVHLAMGEALSLNAQFIHGQLSAYIIALFCVSFILLLNNIEGLIFISSSLIVFIIGLKMIEYNFAKLNGNIINSLTIAIIVFLCTRISYSMYVKEFLINKELEASIKMKDEFLSTISHEFRTPLTVINSAIQAIEHFCGAEMSDRLKGYLDKIKQNSFRQLRLVNNLLDITRANAGHIKINRRNADIVCLTKSIVESVQVYSAQKGIKISVLSSLEQLVTGIDEEKYERILLNLLSNAIKFTPTGKSIVVKLSTGINNIIIEVIDEGVGIPEDKMDLIFERFGQVDSSLTRQAEGTGIGLSLVKLFAEALGGCITVKSKVGEGSTFCLLLPNTTVEREQDGDAADAVCLKEIADNRTVQSTTIEFSDVYLGN
jgi:signal transduction histidine kinase